MNFVQVKNGGWSMVYFPRFQWNVYHRIDGMLLASSKYGKHQLAFKPIRKRAHIFWMSNKLSGFSSKSVLSSRSLLKVTLWDIFPQENLSEYLKIMVSNIVLWGDWLRSIYQIHKKNCNAYYAQRNLLTNQVFAWTFISFK